MMFFGRNTFPRVAVEVCPENRTEVRLSGEGAGTRVG